MEDIIDIIKEVFQQTLMVSGFVLYMMLIIEYINVRTGGTWSKPLKKSGTIQVGLASLIGIVPGCVGIFTVVSLFTHNIIKFPALLSGSIATMGDEAFVMFSMIPSTALKLAIVLILIALSAGIIFNVFFKNKFQFTALEKHYQTHSHDDECFCFNRKDILKNLRKISFQRALMIAILILIVIFQLFGGHGHEHSGDSHGEHQWENIFFIIASVLSIAIVVTVPEHFLAEHLWGHILKEHFLKIFLWTLGSLAIIIILFHFWNVENWVEHNHLVVLILALLIGIIPISGPHVIFITLFAGGTIPFSILLANTIVHEGHGGLPLMAESKKSFIIMKSSKIILALIIGFLGYWMQW